MIRIRSVTGVGAGKWVQGRRLPFPAEREQEAEQMEAHGLLPPRPFGHDLMAQVSADVEHVNPEGLVADPRAQMGRGGEERKPGHSGQFFLSQRFGLEEDDDGLRIFGEHAIAVQFPRAAHPDVARADDLREARKETFAAAG